ncbi:hypothetical protein G9A89_010907 [Geosiphon pyriformis]|nr:hypothetical protein G9A89_010907 [Geosiphon pyriformis]
MVANTTMFLGTFGDTVKFFDLGAMWNVIRKIMVLSAGGAFKKRWFKDFNTVRNKVLSRFHKLELLVSKLVKASYLNSSVSFALLLGTWDNFDSAGALTVRSMFFSGAKFDKIYSALTKVKRLYHSSKLLESKRTKKIHIRQAITNRMKSFELNKGCTIRNVLECPFCKVVLNHLVVGDDLPDGKAAGLLGISNELWKHCDKSVLGLLLVLLNSCLSCELVPGSWKKAWVSMIPKPYEWEGVLTNTYPIALIKTAYKILSKVFSNKISLACSSYDVLHVKYQESMCDYRLNSHFVSESGRTESQTGLSIFLAAGAFIDDTIWVGSSQTATQHILNVASEFFRVNNISINNDKTVAIPINSRVSVPSLFISGSPISVAHRGKPHWYLVLRKVVSDKQFLYLVSAVLHSIIGYRMQFGYIPVGVCNKWNALIRKGLKLKAGLLIDFPSDTIHHPSFYGLKSFLQCQSETSVGTGLLNFCELDDFVATRGCLSQIDVNSLSVYMDGSLKYLGTVDCRAGAVIFFEDINLGLGVGVQGLVSSTLVELQAITLALECVSAAYSVNLFSDSQAALDAWNDCTDNIADAVSLFGWYLFPHMDEHFLLVDDSVVSASSLRSDVNWLSFSRVWHSDLHMATGFISRLTADTCTYLIKTLHCWLPVAVQKCIYNKCYPSILCLYCGKKSLSELSLSSLVVLQFMSTCASDLLVFLALYKGFVFNGWLQEAVTVFYNSKVAGIKITDFMCSLCSTFRNDIWLVRTKHHVFIEKNGLIPVDGSILIPVFGSVLRLSPGVVKLLGITEAFGVLFGFRKSCSFFLGIGDMVFVNIVT